MVTPQSSSIKICNQSRYPLFNKLLKDCRSSAYVPQLACPATAPVLLTTDQRRDMDKHSPPPDKDPGSPLVLQDPPKSRLKRQLSINTQQQSEASRTYKRHATVTSPDDVTHDDSEEEAPATFSSGVSDLASTYRRRYRACAGDEVDGSAPNAPNTSGASGKSDRLLAPSIYCSPTEDVTAPEGKPLPSPNRFNLADIGLTSPFMSLTPKGHSNTDEVFVFPDALPPRKVSPYKSATEVHYNEQPEETLPRRKRVVGESGRDGYLDRDAAAYSSKYADRKLAYGRENENRDIYSKDIDAGRGYVSPKGFIWPAKPNISDPMPFSPRVVTTDSRPRFPTVEGSLSPRKRSEDVARLRVLERELGRAKQIYGSPTKSDPNDTDGRQYSPTSSTMLRNMLRSTVSYEGRSPNEKEIRDVRTDVINRYERSISDPRFSPSQLLSTLQKPSPLSRESSRDHSEPRTAEPLPQDTESSSERYHEPWRDDVKRRLFTRSDHMPSSTSGRASNRFLFDHDDIISGGGTDIPEEVLSFLHSRNFHPEQLENLKDILRQGGHGGGGGRQAGQGAQGDTRYRSPSSATSRYDDAAEAMSPFRRREGGQRSGPSRPRRMGEIDVRVTCDDFTERAAAVSSLLRDLDHETKSCKCGRIEGAMQQMVEHAYTRLDAAETGGDRASRDQREVERQETDAMVYNSMRILCGIKCLCKYGRTLEEVFTGSVVFRLHCPSRDALFDLWHNYRIGDLEKEIQAAFVTEELLDKCGCDVIKLKVFIDGKEYLTCKEELDLLADSNRTPVKQITVIHARSRSEPASVSKQAEQLPVSPAVRAFLKPGMSPFRERFSSDSSVELSPCRRVFKELNGGKVHQTKSPLASRKCRPDSSLMTSSHGSYVTSSDFTGQENVNVIPANTETRL